RHRAEWLFENVPAELAARKDGVPCEFGFDIFRLTKGEENKGVLVKLVFETWRWNPARTEAKNRATGAANAQNRDALVAERYGIFEPVSKEIADYHTEAIVAPASLFQNQLASRADIERAAEPLRAKAGNLSRDEQEQLTALEQDLRQLKDWEDKGQPR